MPKKKREIVSVFDNDKNPNFRNYEHTQIWKAIKELAVKVAKNSGSISTIKWAIGVFLPIIIALLTYLILH